ncbi:MAG: beta-galactosidase [Nitrospira sp.]|nr:beta-galactosidase [Nitrospira sp.]
MRILFNGHPPEADEYPHTTVAYFRWPWAELEPAEGQYNFALVDGIIAQAKAKGETLAIRIVSEYKTGTPQWLLDKGVGSVKESDGIFPDYNHPIFLAHHERLIRAFGDRYGRSLDIDHVDIGSVGCWGEWNTACRGWRKRNASSPHRARRQSAHHYGLVLQIFCGDSAGDASWRTIAVCDRARGRLAR